MLEEGSFYDTHHQKQHNHGYESIAPLGKWKYFMQEQRKAWAWGALKHELGVESMSQADPVDVWAWAFSKELHEHLPQTFASATVERA